MRTSKSAFHLDQQFFVELRARLEQTRRRANEQHQALLDWIKTSLDKQSGGTWQLQDPQAVAHPPETIPPVEQLAHLVQTAFWASLEKEEGRPLYFTVNYMAPEPSGKRLIAFDEPLPYEGQTLIKLAPAIGATDAALLVAPVEQGRLKIWGVRDRSLAPLSIKVIDPGSVIIKFKETNIAAISRSEAVHIRDPLLTRSSVIWSRFGAGEAGAEYDQWADPRINAILETVKRMRNLRHGGTLIIVPAGSQWRDSVKLPITYSGGGLFSPFQESIPKLRELRQQTGHTWAEEMYWWTVTTEACRMLSHLTAVDGALLLTYELEIIGFGAKLQPAPTSVEPAQIFNVDPLDHDDWIRRVTLMQLGGTRHQSAARFVADQREAIAFVVSQDGDVSAFVWWQPPHNAPALYAHRRLELTLF